MPRTKRTPINRPEQQRVSPRAVELFAYLLKRERRADFSSDDSDYNAAAWELHAELRLPPGAPRIDWVDENERLPANLDPIHRKIDERVIALRRELLLLARPRPKAPPRARRAAPARSISGDSAYASSSPRPRRKPTPRPKVL
jgi:hypothetical protein